MIQKRIPKWLSLLIIVLLTLLIVLTATILPFQLKEAHARNVANTQCEYMQEKLKEGTPAETVKALTQANITPEYQSNTDFDFTLYTINIDEEQRTCHIDVRMAYGKRYKSFSSEELSY